MSIPRKVDPRNSNRYVYQLDGRWWTLVELASLSGWIKKTHMRHRLATWEPSVIWADIVHRWEQTAEFRAGRPLKPYGKPIEEE